MLYRALQYRLDLYTLSKTQPSQWDIMLTFSGRPSWAILIIGMCLYSQADSAKLCRQAHSRSRIFALIVQDVILQWFSKAEDWMVRLKMTPYVLQDNLGRKSVRHLITKGISSNSASQHNACTALCRIGLTI